MADRPSPEAEQTLRELGHPAETHEEHVDERWLVSYADMMTLLFGLFVLLFSMSTMDKKAAERMAREAQKSFRGEAAGAPPQAGTEPATKVIEDLRRELEDSRRRISEAEERSNTLEHEYAELQRQKDELEQRPSEKTRELAQKLRAVTAERKKLAADLLARKPDAALEDLLRDERTRNAKLAAKIENLNQRLTDVDDQNRSKSAEIERQNAADTDRATGLSRKIASLEAEKQKLTKQLQTTRAKAEDTTEVDRLREELERAERDVREREAELAAARAVKASHGEQMNERLRELQTEKQRLAEELKRAQSEQGRSAEQLSQIEDLRRQNQELTARATSLNAERESTDELKSKVNSLEAQLKQMSDANSTKQSFMAFFINWSTKDHDIDLVIQDPQGKTFDFKHRKFAGHPGNFALDTRRGPGAELWQSDKLIPGRYKATYVFYNQYGNPEPADVSGSIFTPKGSVVIPTVKMDTAGKRRFEAIFDIDADGNVKLKAGP